MSKKASSAVNQQETRCFKWGSSETIRQAPLSYASRSELKAYLLGAIHDATLSKKGNVRFSQKKENWLEVISAILDSLDYGSWIYQEGKSRDVYVLETTADFLDFNFNSFTLNDEGEESCYIRGFFDADGGIPQDNEARFYIQLAQKDKEKVMNLKRMLNDLDIETGKIHNPSSKVDPHYWRIYVLADFHEKFIEKVGSWHPRKYKLLRKRMMI